MVLSRVGGISKMLRGVDLLARCLRAAAPSGSARTIQKGVCCIGACSKLFHRRCNEQPCTWNALLGFHPSLKRANVLTSIQPEGIILADLLLQTETEAEGRQRQDRDRQSLRSVAGSHVKKKKTQKLSAAGRQSFLKNGRKTNRSGEKTVEVWSFLSGIVRLGYCDRTRCDQASLKHRSVEFRVAPDGAVLYLLENFYFGKKKKKR